MFDSRQVVHDWGGWQGPQEAPAVAFGAQPRVQHGQDSPVLPVPDQAPQPLLQGQKKEELYSAFLLAGQHHSFALV